MELAGIGRKYEVLSDQEVARIYSTPATTLERIKAQFRILGASTDQVVEDICF